jgi:hypothetical protein
MLVAMLVATNAWVPPCQTREGRVAPSGEWPNPYGSARRARVCRWASVAFDPNKCSAD